MWSDRNKKVAEKMCGTKISRCLKHGNMAYLCRTWHRPQISKQIQSIVGENSMTSNSKATKTQSPRNFLRANVARLGGFQTESVLKLGFRQLREKERRDKNLNDYRDHPLGE